MKPLKIENKPRGWVVGAKWAQATCQARVVRVLVGVSPRFTWCIDLIGKERLAIEVKLDDQTFYVDNEDGKALKVMLEGRAPIPGFRFLPVFQILSDPAIKPFYK